jgi:tetratricopeptide (TPR) repeat protein
MGMKRDSAATLSNLGELARQRGDYPAARVFQQEAIAVVREFGDTRGVGWGLWALANLAVTEQAWDEARSLYEEALEVARQLRDRKQLACCLTGLGEIAEAQGDDGNAWRLYEEALALQRAVNDNQGIASSLCRFGRLCQIRAEPERAARLLSAAESYDENYGWVLPVTERAAREPHLAAARAALGEAAFAAAWAEGRAMTLDQAIRDALKETGEV